MAVGEHCFHVHKMNGLSYVEDVVGCEGYPGEGPHMAVFLRIAHDGEGDRIEGARFDTYGCPAAITCGQGLTRWLVGKTLATAGEIEPNELMIAVGGLPLGKEHCAELAINALRRALRKVHN